MAHTPRIGLATIVLLGWTAIAAAQLQQHYAPPEVQSDVALPSVVGPLLNNLDMDPKPALPPTAALPQPPAPQPSVSPSMAQQPTAGPNPPTGTPFLVVPEIVATPPAGLPPVAAGSPAEVKPSTIMIIKPEDCIPPPKPAWSGSVEFGINGASGNSDLLKLRGAFNAKHEIEQHKLTFDITYNYADSNSRETENKALAKERYEWLFKDSPWSLFDEDELEYDRFKSYDLRLSDHGGVGYMFFKDEITKFKGLGGVGESWKFGGPDEGGTTELLAGLEYERQLSERQKFTFAGEMFPAVNSWGDFRSDAKIGYELLVDPVWNITLKLGATDRYDSQATGKKPNDVEYFGVLLWKF